MHEIHLAVDPHSSSKKQALEVIGELQKNFPIKRSPMRLQLTVPGQNFHSLCEKLNEWGVTIVSKDESGSHPSVVSPETCCLLYCHEEKCLTLHLVSLLFEYFLHPLLS